MERFLTMRETDRNATQVALEANLPTARNHVKRESGPTCFTNRCTHHPKASRYIRFDTLYEPIGIRSYAASFVTDKLSNQDSENFGGGASCLY
jgi:hypothetical protein